MISPADLAAELSAADQAALVVAERDIDLYLQSQYGNKPEIWIAVKWSERICRELILRYESVGWRVRLEHDQRDGDALVFRP